MINCIYYDKFKINNVCRSGIKLIFNTVFYRAEQNFIVFCDLGTGSLYAWKQKSKVIS